MAFLKPDPTFYPSARLATEAPPEKIAYVAALAPDGKSRPDALLAVDADPQSPHYGREIDRLVLPNSGDELHHFGWNACSSALCPWAPHPHLERRYLVVPGLRSSRIHIIDTKGNGSGRKLKLEKVIEPAEIFRRTGYSRPHTVHCGPEGLYVSALGAPDGNGPGGIFLLDHFNFNVLGRWEVDRGPQMVEVSRDGRRVYLSSSLYSSWDPQFYPAGLDSWLVKADTRDDGSFALDPRFFVAPTDYRLHQVRLEGGDASSDSYCFPN